MIPLRQIRPAWWLDAACLAGFVAVTAVLAGGLLLDFDLAVRDFVDGHRPRWLHIVLMVPNFLGSGGYLSVLCLLIALWRMTGRFRTSHGDSRRSRTWRDSETWRALRDWRDSGTWRNWRSWWPVYPIALAYVLTFLTIGPLKFLTHRPAPRAEGTTGAFFDTAEHVSYPSGHTTNTLVWYAVLAIVAAPWLTARWKRILRIVPPIVVTFTTVYLGYHWLTDSVAGLLLGLPLARLLDRVDWPALGRGGGSADS